MIKKFSDYTLKENATANWEDALYNACKSKFYGDDEPSIFNEIIDEAFGPEFKGDKPEEEDIKAKLIEWINDSLNNYVFTEKESDELENNSEME